eukprot:3771450-Rhodomonas_salina.2
MEANHTINSTHAAIKGGRQTWTAREPTRRGRRREEARRFSTRGSSEGRVCSTCLEFGGDGVRPRAMHTAVPHSAQASA